MLQLAVVSAQKFYYTVMRHEMLYSDFDQRMK